MTSRLLSHAELADYGRDGFLVCRGLFRPEEVAELRRATDEIQAWPELPGAWMVYGEQSLREPGRRLVNRIENFYPHHPGFKAVFDGDKLLGRVADLLGEPAVLFKDKINFKLPGGGGFEPHQDQQAGWSVYAPLFVTALVAIDGATQANGCLELAAGHHTRGLIGPEWAPLSEATLRGVDFVPYPTEPGRRRLLRLVRPPPVRAEPIGRAAPRALRHVQPAGRRRPSGPLLRGEAPELPARRGARAGQAVRLPGLSG